MAASAPQRQRVVQAALEPVIEPELKEEGILSFLLLRVFEVCIAVIALVLAAPVMAIVGFIIGRGTPGPVMFRQDRVGKDEKLFRFTKFRTLYADARERWPELYAYQYTDDEIQRMAFKIVNDPRVTPQGVWLRKSTLDELPNFWNVLNGSMALVGPRPEIPEMLQYYTGEARLKFRVRPGVTGLAQISGRGRLSFKDTVRLDLEYVRNRSFALDLRILVLTVVKIITRDGAF